MNFKRWELDSMAPHWTGPLEIPVGFLQVQFVTH